MGYYCGIDLGNKRTAICIIDKKRQVKEEIQVDTNGKALGNVLLSKIRTKRVSK